MKMNFSKSFRLFPIVALFLLVGIELVHPYEQVLILHHKNGEIYIHNENTPEVDYLGSSFDRICSTGWWMLYSEYNYNESLALLLNNEDGSERCYDTITLPIKSFRHGGAQDTEIAEASFYSESLFQGQEIKVTNSSFGGFSATSAIITGHLNWTIYEGSLFDGQSTCMRPLDYPMMIVGLLLTPILWEGVGSVAQGCQDDPTNF